MMDEFSYGEIKARKHIYPQTARDLVAKGTIDFLLTEGKISDKTKEILKEGGVIAYEGVSVDIAQAIRNRIKENKAKGGTHDGV